MSFTRAITVKPDDIDELGHVNNAVWVRWIQDMATAHWSATADPDHVAAYIWVVVRHEIDYMGNAGPGEVVSATTWIDEPPKGARFARNVAFANAAGKTLVKARTVWAILDRETGRLVRVPQAVADAFIPPV